MMRGDTERIMREGPRQALMEAMANLYRVYTSPNHALEPVAIKADCIRNDGRSWRILQG